MTDNNGFQMNRRGFLVTLTGLASVPILASCSSGSPTQQATSTAGAKAAKQFTYWSNWNKGEPTQQVLASVFSDFQDKSGITVQAQWKGRKPVQKLLPALNTGNVPADLISDNTGQIVNVLGSTESARNLSSVYGMTLPGEKHTVKDLIGRYEGYAKPEGKQTLVMFPYVSQFYVMWYNGKSFPHLKDNPPENWSEFFKLLDSLRAKGRRPLALDGSNPAYNLQYFNNFAWSIGSYDQWIKAATDKTGKTWNQEPFQKAAELVEKLVKGDYFIEGYKASKFPAMQQKWANNESDFIMNGTWTPTESKPYAAPGFEYRSFPFPAVKGHKAPPIKLGFQGMAIVNKVPKARQEAAAALLPWLLTKEAQEQFAKKAFQMPVRTDVKAPDQLADALKALKSGNITPHLPPPSVTPYVNKVLKPADDDLVFGKSTAKDFIANLQSASQAYWARQQG